jgi:beta-glucuronidase
MRAPSRLAATLSLAGALALCSAQPAPGPVPTPAPLPGLLQPIDSESRTVLDISGIWSFANEAYPGQGTVDQWYARPLAQSTPVIDMPVPSSYNDITQNATLRDFVGVVWYETVNFVPANWAGSRVMLYFGSAHYFSQVWINGAALMEHDGGHLPFEADVTALVAFGNANRVSLALNNTLTAVTLPPGSLSNNSAGDVIQNVQFDFFNYAGIHRRVQYYSTPATVHVDDLTTVTTLVGSTALLRVDVVTTGGATVSVALTDVAGVVVASNSSATAGGNVTLYLSVANANLWWPYTMSPTPGYLYSLSVTAAAAAGGATDVYRLNVGLRTTAVTANQFLINGVPFYMRGFGKHEDAHIRGKGMDLPIINKDFNLLQWFGANMFRSSHYPYSDQIMDFADRYGIAVIDEAPAVGLALANFLNETLVHHLVGTLRRVVGYG